MTGSYIKVLDTQIYLYKEGQGPPLLFIHGHRADVLRWKKIVDLLSSHFTVYAPDLPGFGKSPMLPKGSHNLKMLAFYLKALTETLRLENFAIFGASMGGMIALLLANQTTGKVSRLAVIGTPTSAHYFKLSKKRRLFLATFFTLIGYTPLSHLADAVIKNDTVLGYLLKRTFSPERKDDKALLTYEMRQWRVMPAKVYAQTGLSSINFELPKKFHLEIPTFILGTHLDHLIDMDLSTKLLEKKAPNHKTVWLPMERHIPMGELDDSLVRTLKPYLADLA